jgi:DNA recombination protein RmuC
VIDSKVSLVAWTDYTGATDEAARASALKAHLASVRAHVKGLAGKRYHDLPGLASPDFVVLFIPIEPAALLALQSDANLWQDAYRSNILIAGPTTLLFVIRIVDNLWQQEQQARNVREIADRGARLYEKFVGFVDDMQQLGNRLTQARASYDAAFGKLSSGSGNLLGQVEKLQQLGVKPSKTLPAQLVARALEENSPAAESLLFGVAAVAADTPAPHAAPPE